MKSEKARNQKRRKKEDEKRGSKIGRSGSGNNWIGRSRSRNWDSIWSIYYRKITKPFKRGEEV